MKATHLQLPRRIGKISKAIGRIDDPLYTSFDSPNPSSAFQHVYKITHRESSFQSPTPTFLTRALILSLSNHP